MAIDKDAAIKRQLDAMGLVIFRVGVLTVAPDDSKMMKHYNWRHDDIMKSLPKLRAMNAHGANINIGPPEGDHHLSLIDDLKPANIQQMKDNGFAPALVVETSHGNYQAWVNHGQVLPQDVRDAASKALAKEFSGNPNAAEPNHMGRLVHFTNRKEIRQLPDGSYPWVRLVESYGRSYPRAKGFIANIGRQLELSKAVGAERARSCVPTPNSEGLLTVVLAPTAIL